MKRPKRTIISEASLNYIGIPRKFHEDTIEDFQTYGSESLVKTKQYFKDYINEIEEGTVLDSNRGVFMFGSNGIGKTFLASVILKHAYVCRYTARRTTFVEYMTEYTRMWGIKSNLEKEEQEEEFYTKYKGVEFLVLEEVGKEVDNKASAPILEDLLRYREDKGLVTIICTNLTPKDLECRYGASVCSLVKGNMIPVLIEGLDKRLPFFEERGDLK